MGKIVYEITEDSLDLYVENIEEERILLASFPIEDIELSELVSDCCILINAGVEVSLKLSVKESESK